MILALLSVKKFNPLGCHLDLTLFDASLHMLIVYPLCSIYFKIERGFWLFKAHSVERVLVVGRRSMRLIFYFCKACSVRIWFQTPFYPLRRACAYDLSSQTRRPRLIRGYYLYANCLGEFDVHAYLVPIMSLSWILIYKFSDLSVCISGYIIIFICIW